MYSSADLEKDAAPNLWISNKKREEKYEKTSFK